MILFFWTDFHCLVNFDLSYFLNTLIKTRGSFLNTANKPKSVFHEFQMWLTGTSKFCFHIPTRWLSNNKIYSLSNGYWPTFKNGRQETFKKGVLITDITAVFATALCYIVSDVPERCTENKLFGYILGTYIFENSMNFKNLKPSAVVSNF